MAHHKTRIIQTLLAFSITGIFATIFFVTVPVQGIRSDVLILSEREAYPSDTITAVAKSLLKQSDFNEYSMDVTNVVGSNVLTYTTYGQTFTHAQKGQVRAIRNIEIAILKNLGVTNRAITFRTIGEPYPMLRAPMIVGLLILSAVLGTLLSSLIMSFVKIEQGSGSSLRQGYTRSEFLTNENIQHINPLDSLDNRIQSNDEEVLDVQREVAFQESDEILMPRDTHDNKEIKTNIAEEDVESNEVSQKVVFNRNATAVVPSNLPIVEIPEEKPSLEKESEATDVAEKMTEVEKNVLDHDIRNIVGEPTQEDLKKRLNQLLNGGL